LRDRVPHTRTQPAYILEDAERAVEASRHARERAGADAEASSARSAVFLYYAALEGFINFVYAWAEVDGPHVRAVVHREEMEARG
jgi:hypothetical protein